MSNSEEKIYQAFQKVLTEKKYSEIRIQDILNESGIARSTFYAHYKTKEDLLASISTHIFEHVFSHSLDEEKSHDFSKTSIFDYRHFFTHILYHLDDEKELITAIFSSESKTLFLNLIREAMKPFATTCIKNNFVTKKNVPEDLQIATLIENFILIIEYWVKTAFKEAPEQLTDYYFALIS